MREFIMSEVINYREKQLKLSSLDNKLISKYLNIDKDIIDELYSSFKFFKFYIIRITAPFIILILLKIGYDYFTNHDINKFIKFLGIIPLILVTGLPIFFPMQKIQKIERKILDESKKYFEYLKFTIGKTLLISKESPRSLKLNYLVWGNFSIIIVCTFVVIILNNFTSSNVGIINIFEKIYQAPINYYIENSGSLQWYLIGVIAFYALLFAPTMDMEIKRENNLKKYYKIINWVNFCFLIIHFISHLHGIKLAIKNVGLDMSVLEFMENGFWYYTFINYLYIQGFLVLFVHNMNTLQSRKKNNSTMLWIFEYFLLLPFFLFYGVFAYFLPNVVLLLLTFIIYNIFHLCIEVYKIPSALRLIGFICSIGLFYWSLQ